ncbi:MAG: hypothetical protein IKP73_04480, partial [Bacteroidales bacterium]|nr:hypothetical protein [Bacteroidales bacterium]
TRTASETTAIQKKLNALYQATAIDNAMMPGLKDATNTTSVTTAFKAFKNTMGGTVAVDGKYGTATKKAVSALQTFLKSLGISIGASGIDGKYGKDTDKATGWKILS